MKFCRLFCVYLTGTGISSFAKNLDPIGPEHLAPLLEHATQIIPKDQVKETPVFLLATAGMRLLPEHEQQELISHVCAYLDSSTDFYLPECKKSVQVIDGQTEGLYGWIATNYLVGGFSGSPEHDHGKGHNTYGFLDMGGASAQIAFAPNATEAERHANDLTLLRLRNLDGSAQEHKVFTTSWLGYGVHQARSRYVSALVEQTGYTETSKQIPDPCLPSGLLTTFNGTIVSQGHNQPYLMGTGRFDECLRRTFPLLDKDAPCPDEPCLVHGIHVPAIDFDVNHFIGVSEYWHTTHQVFEIGLGDRPYNFNTYQRSVENFCTASWQDIRTGVEEKKWGQKVDEKLAMEICFKASWLINVLHDGIGIPRIGIEKHNGNRTKAYQDPFQAIDKIESTEVTWTLGKALLVASSEVSPPKDGLPVGFGSNVPGIPEDFNYPAAGPLPNEGSIPEHEHWHDRLFDGESPRRLPGFLLFLLIVLIVVFFMACGRDRRNRLWRSLSSHRPHRGFGIAGLGSGLGEVKFPSSLSSLFSRCGGSSSRGAYERVLEEGYVYRDLELDGPSVSGSHPDSPITPSTPDGSTAAAVTGRGSLYPPPSPRLSSSRLSSPTGRPSLQRAPSPHLSISPHRPSSMQRATFDSTLSPPSAAEKQQQAQADSILSPSNDYGRRSRVDRPGGTVAWTEGRSQQRNGLLSPSLMETATHTGWRSGAASLSPSPSPDRGRDFVATAT